MKYAVKRMKSDVSKFHCIPCNKDVSCGHQGIRDVKEHCEGALHKTNVKASRGN